MTLTDKLDVIHRYMPGTLADIAMMVPCHINTLKKIRAGDNSVRPIIANRLEELYQKAIKIRDIAEA